MIMADNNKLIAAVVVLNLNNLYATNYHQMAFKFSSFIGFMITNDKGYDY